MADADRGLGAATAVRGHAGAGSIRVLEHTHTVEEDGPGATNIRDRVRYSIPFGPLGELANRLLVQRDLKQIFDYRRDAVARELVPEDLAAP